MLLFLSVKQHQVQRDGLTANDHETRKGIGGRVALWLLIGLEYRTRFWIHGSVCAREKSTSGDYFSCLIFEVGTDRPRLKRDELVLKQMRKI
jgi:hypothetical protein